MNWPCCDECWNKGLPRVWNYERYWEDPAIKQACWDGISDRKWWAEIFDGKADSVEAKKFFFKILFGCSQMEHKHCVMSMLEVFPEEPFSDLGDHGSLPFICSDLEMTHSLQTRTNFINSWYSGTMVKKMPIDVYRYIVAHADDKQKITHHMALSAAQFANTELLNYIAENEAQHLDEKFYKQLPCTLAYACAFTDKDGQCIQAALDHQLCNSEDIAREFNREIESFEPLLTTEEESGLRQNLAQLVKNGYICGSEFCYAIDA